jgi:translation initiation factor IF-2
MSKSEKNIRVYTLAQELGLDSKELIDYLKDLNIEVKSHMSNLDSETAELVKDEVGAILGKKKKEELDRNPKIAVEFPITVRELAAKLGAKPNEMQKKLLEWKVFANINQPLKEDIALKLGEEFGFILKRQLTEEEEFIKTHEDKEEGALQSRYPIVTLMGHVDHGKTTLLEKIRDLELTNKEHGGITQHIGAYEVEHNGKKITFVDTPGHEAFTSMRARGANVTDIVILVVAADDGVLPQTVEAIDHAKAAEVPIIVAINKIDRPEANIDKVKRELSEANLTPEDWGGDIITVELSALTGKGIDTLLDMVILQSEMMELKANPDKPAKGIVLESKVTKGGPFVSVIIQSGTLRVGDMLLAGTCHGKVRALFNDLGLEVDSVGPSDPVGILGLNGIPESGEGCLAVKDESKVKDIVTTRKESRRQKKQAPAQRMSLKDLGREGQNIFKLILKADVYGSLDAVGDSLEKLKESQKEELDIKILHKGIGNITESDVVLALASDAFVVGFNVGINDKAKTRAKKERVEVRLYSIIYELIEDIDKVFKGFQEPELEERFLGRVEVRKIFDVSKVGTIAGCLVSKGKVQRNSPCRLLRGKNVVYEGRVTSLKRFKDDAKEVSEGYECGVGLEGHNDITEGDIIEAYTMIEV